MNITRRSLLSSAAALLVAQRGSAHQASETSLQYTPGDPARVGRTGRPQLVEFFHPR